VLSPVQIDNLEHLTQRAIERAVIMFSNGECESAEKVLTAHLIESEANTGSAFERKPEILELLAISFLRQGKLEAAEKVMQTFVGEQCEVDKCGSAIWELFHSLAQVSVGKEDLVIAQDWCQRAVDVARGQFGADSVPYCTSVHLLVDIFEMRGNQREADRYKTLLPQDSLLYYVYGGVEKTVSAMLKMIKVSREDCDRALVVAVDRGQNEIVRLLLENGADSKTMDENGKPVLLCAAEKGFTDIVVALLENGANVDATEKFDLETGLMLATRNGHKDTVKVFLQYDANRNLKNWYGITFLDLTRRKKNKVIARMLKKEKITKRR